MTVRLRSNIVFIAGTKCRHVESARGDFTAGTHWFHSPGRHRVTVSLAVITAINVIQSHLAFDELTHTQLIWPLRVYMSYWRLCETVFF